MNLRQNLTTKKENGKNKREAIKMYQTIKKENTENENCKNENSPNNSKTNYAKGERNR
jgi:hypothetical protein